MTLEEFIIQVILPKNKTELGLMLIDCLGLSYIALSEIDGLFSVFTHGVIAVSVAFGLFVKVHNFFKKPKNPNEEL